MAQFRKKPVVIEAVQHFADRGQHANEWPVWLIQAINSGAIFARGNQTVIKTLEGEHIASDGDWIIRGVKGELYPCKPDIFAATYEPALATLEEAPAEAGERECDWCDGRKTKQTPSTDFTIVCPYCKGTGKEALRAQPQAREDAQPVAWPDKATVRASTVRSRSKLGKDDLDRHNFAFEVAETIIGDWIVKGDKRGNRDLMIQAVDLALSIFGHPKVDATKLQIATEALGVYAEQGFVGAQLALDKIGSGK